MRENGVLLAIRCGETLLLCLRLTTQQGKGSRAEEGETSHVGLLTVFLASSFAAAGLTACQVWWRGNVLEEDKAEEMELAQLGREATHVDGPAEDDEERVGMLEDGAWEGDVG